MIPTGKSVGRPVPTRGASPVWFPTWPTGNRRDLTPDLGGRGTTATVTERVIAQVMA